MRTNSIITKIKIISAVIYLLVLVPPAKGDPGDPDSSNFVPSEISYGVEMDFNNKYLWRGIVYNDGFVIQPNIWVSYHNFILGIWSNATIYDIHHSIERNEVDLSFTYEYSLWNFKINNSFMYYNYPQQPDSPPTGELYIGIGYPIGEITLTSSFIIDVIEYPGAYFVEHGVEYETALTDELNVSSSLSLGWASGKFNETYVGILETTVSLLSWNLSLEYSPLDYFHVKPHLEVNRILDERLYEYLNRYSSSFGLMIGMEF